jgi:preprotein translocase subunit SecF
MFAVRNRVIFYTISVFLISASIASVFVWGLNYGIDFKGGALLEVSYTGTRPDIEEMKASLAKLSLKEYSIRPTGTQGFIVRTLESDEATHQKLLGALTTSTSLPKEERFDSIGPTLGTELEQKAWLSIGLVMLAIVGFITFAFRKVSEPVSSWKYGLVAILALLHDVIIPIGAYSALGHFFGYEVDTLFVTALLVILGFSVHDTIVVFDRVRENLRRNRENRLQESFDETVGKSLMQTMARSINTSLTTILALLALYFVGSEATKHFSLALLIGISAGTYSSIFIASMLLVTLQKWSAKA